MYLKVSSTDTADSLSNLLKDGEWMVLYYADWCGHCNAMKPEWEKVVSRMSECKDTRHINIADVKSDFIDELKQKPQVDGFPTIKMYNKGKEIAVFGDERNADKIEKFAISNSNKAKISVKNIVANNTPKPEASINTIVISNKPSMEESVSVKLDNVAPKGLSIGNLQTPPPTPTIDEKHLSKKTLKKILVSNIECSQLLKAKQCKKKANCYYDYDNFKCKSKILSKVSKKISKKLSKEAKRNNIQRMKQRGQKSINKKTIKKLKQTALFKSTKDIIEKLKKSINRISTST